MKQILTIAAVLLASGLLAACSDLGYYAQSINGHMSMMAQTRPINALVDDPQTSGEDRQRFLKVLEIRDFAVTELDLPDNDSYRRYADIGRPYVIWNVVAAPEFSLEPKVWCFPVAGCVVYRGYFDQAAAEELGARLQQEGFDVNVYGVPAYSTLNWFNDPVLNTFFSVSEGNLAALLFHELAHQVVYLADDSSFSEAFAKTVEVEGVRRWFEERATKEEMRKFLEDEAQTEIFQGLLSDTRNQLVELYRRPLPEAEMRKAKLELFKKTGVRYTQLKKTGKIDDRFDAWMERGLNNARLAALATYNDLVPGFQAILEQNGGDLVRFYEEVTILSTLPEPQRYFRLKGRFQFEQYALRQTSVEKSPAVAE